MMNFYKFNFIIFVTCIFVTCIFVGCVSQASRLDMVDNLPIHEGAYDINKRKLGSISNQQLSYKLKETYPSTKVLTFYDKYFLSSDWKKCIGKIEIWQSFVDATNKQELTVHQIAHYFIKGNENKLGIIFLRYNSKATHRKTNPDNDTQNIFILMQRNVNLKAELSRLSVSCSE